MRRSKGQWEGKFTSQCGGGDSKDIPKSHPKGSGARGIGNEGGKPSSFITEKRGDHQFYTLSGKGGLRQ